MEVIAARVSRHIGNRSGCETPRGREIPAVDFDHSNRFKLAVIDSPASVAAEAYRTLRTALLAMWQRHPTNAGLVAATPGGLSGNGSDPVVPPLKVLLITSPGPAEGKSVTVANLAAVLAETGKSVIALDADFRRPTLNKYLGCSSSTPDLLTLGKDCTRDQVWGALQENEGSRCEVARHDPESDCTWGISGDQSAKAVVARA